MIYALPKHACTRTHVCWAVIIETSRQNPLAWVMSSLLLVLLIYYPAGAIRLSTLEVQAWWGMGSCGSGCRARRAMPASAGVGQGTGPVGLCLHLLATRLPPPLPACLRLASLVSLPCTHTSSTASSGHDTHHHCISAICMWGKRLCYIFTYASFTFHPQGHALGCIWQPLISLHGKIKVIFLSTNIILWAIKHEPLRSLAWQGTQGFGFRF